MLARRSLRLSKLTNHQQKSKKKSETSPPCAATMTSKNMASRLKTAIEIPLPSIRRYVPGSGPPPPRITLAPPRDSTAYIIDQYVLPPLKDTTETTRRLLHYHIGFTDLPSVKLVIPCHKALDYVSPRELEDWEYRNTETKEQEKAQRVTEGKKRGPAGKSLGRVGRPPQKRLPSAAPRSTSVATSAEDALMLAQRVAGPSLSTPQKRKLQRMLDEEDGGETSNQESDGVAIYRQLNGESDGTGAEMGVDGDVDGDADSVDQLPVLSKETPSKDSSRATSTASPFRAAPPQSISGTSSPSRIDKQPPKPTITPLSSSVVSTPKMFHPAWAQSFGLQSRRATTPLSLPGQNGHAQPSSSLMSPTPKAHPPKSQNNQRQSLLSFSDSTPVPASRVRSRSQGSTPRPSTPAAGSRSALTAGSSASRQKESATKKRRRESRGSKENKPRKPRDKKEKKDPKQDRAQREVDDDDEIEEDVWVVKELLDDRWVHEKGAKVHMYLVNWEGDWPPDQNPSWEPAENIQDDNLVEEYRRRKRAGLLKPDQAQRTLLSFLSKTQYSNVSEAFEGEGAEKTKPSGTGVESDSDEPEEELLVTEHIEKPPAAAGKVGGSVF